MNLIWIKYDEDESGDLDYEEARSFMNEVMKNMDDAFELSDNRFRKHFEKYDKDKGGTLDKEEMTGLITDMLKIHNISKTLSMTTTEKKSRDQLIMESRMIDELIEEHWEFHDQKDENFLDRHGTDLFI